MEIVNATVALGGDRGCTVVRRGITPSEVAVLRSIHGEDAVFDIEATGETVKRAHRDEIRRLKERYGRANDANQNSIVGGLFPGAAAPAFETIESLGLPSVLLKPTPAKPSKKTASAKADLAPAEALSPAAAAGIDMDDDGIEDINA